MIEDGRGLANLAIVDPLSANVEPFLTHIDFLRNF